MLLNKGDTFNDIDVKIAAAIGFSLTCAFILDDADARISTVAAYSPTLVSGSSLFKARSISTNLFSTTLDVEPDAETMEHTGSTKGDMLDNINATIANVTGHSPTRFSILDDIDARIAAITVHTPLAPTSV
jgi:hypothetical protein